MLPNPASQARSAATNSLSSLSSRAQSSKPFLGILLYVLVTGLGFGLLGLAAVRSPWSYKLTFGVLQVAVLLLGWLYTARLGRWLPWLGEGRPWWPQALAMVVTAALGGGAIWALRWLPWAKGQLPPTGFIAAVIPFLVPFFFWQAWRAWQAFPPRQYKLWRYSPLAPSPDLARLDLNHFMVVHFWMTRRLGESLYHDFSSKAPYQMRLSDLFTIFLTDYNKLKPDQALQYVDGQGQSYGWLFYAKRPWFRGRHYYDPDLTFQDNFLRQGSIIVAQRVPMSGVAAG